MHDKEKVIEIVRKHFRELPPEETCQFRPEDYELPEEEITPDEAEEKPSQLHPE